MLRETAEMGIVSALLMTSADDNFWTCPKAEEYYRYAVVNYIGFRDKGVLLAGGCGDSNADRALGRPTPWSAQ